MSLRSIAGTLPFAHLAGLSRKAKKADDEEMKREEEFERCEEEDEETASASEDDEESKKVKKGKKAKKAKKAKHETDDGESDEDDNNDDDGDDGDEEDDVDGDGTDEDDEDAKKGKKASAFARGRRCGRKAERKRIGAILNSPAAANNIQLASRLACNSDLPASAVVAMLETANAGAAQPARRGLSNRMADADLPHIGPAAARGAPTKDAEIAAGWAAAAAEFMPAK